MAIQQPPLPPATVDATTWHAWDIHIRAQAHLMQEQENVKLEAYRQALLVEERARTAAIEAQAAAMTTNMDKLDAYTDAELMRSFMSSLSSDWGTAGRGALSVYSTALGMLTEYRKKFPAPAPTP